jgi:hypothetical protein
MATDKTYKGQLQVVEGSVVGEFYTTTKSDYAGNLSPVYLGECEIGCADSQNRHFIQKFLYDTGCTGSFCSGTGSFLSKIVIATNETTLGSTNININILTANAIEITLNSGDCAELNPGDGVALKSGIYNINGTVLRKNSDTDFVVATMNITTGLVNASNLAIAETDLMCHLENEKTKSYTKRRWDNRSRYVYV